MIFVYCFLYCTTTLIWSLKLIIKKENAFLYKSGLQELINSSLLTQANTKYCESTFKVNKINCILTLFATYCIFFSSPLLFFITSFKKIAMCGREKSSFNYSSSESLLDSFVIVFIDCVHFCLFTDLFSVCSSMLYLFLICFVCCCLLFGSSDTCVYGTQVLLKLFDILFVILTYCQELHSQIYSARFCIFLQKQQMELSSNSTTFATGGLISELINHYYLPIEAAANKI